jgi:hypothetical protein
MRCGGAGRRGGRCMRSGACAGYRASQGSNRRRHFHSRTTRGDRRSRDSRSLGRRPHRRREEQPHRDARGTSVAFCQTDQSAQQRYCDRGRRADPTRGQAARSVAALVDLGSRAGDGAAQKLHGGHRSESLLLRSAKPVAARLERKYKWAAASVLP